MSIPTPSVAPGGAPMTLTGVARSADPPDHPPPLDLPVVADTVVDVGWTFEDFYRSTRSSIGRAVAITLGDVDLAAEATDEAMVRAYERWSQISGYDKPEAWVYRVAMNWSRSALRRRRRRDPRLHDPRVVEMPTVGDPAVRTALAELDVKHRSVVVCRYLLDWSVEDTATALKVRPGTVKSRLHRANQILQARLSHLRSPQEYR